MHLHQVTNLHFRGARIFLAVIEDLLAKGMKNAENVLFYQIIIPHIVAVIYFSCS